MAIGDELLEIAEKKIEKKIELSEKWAEENESLWIWKAAYISASKRKKPQAASKAYWGTIETKSFTDAKKSLAATMLIIPDAFIIAFKNGHPVPIKEIIKTK